MNSCRYFESLEKDSLLSLDFDVFWPGNISGQVFFWLNASSNAEVLWPSLHQRMYSFLLFRLGRNYFPRFNFLALLKEKELI